MAAATKDLPTRQSDGFGTVLVNTFKLIRASWEGLLLNLRTFILLFLPLVLFASLLVGIPLLALSAAGFSESKPTTINTADINIGVAVAGAVAMLGLLISVVIFSIGVTTTTIASARNHKVAAKDVLNQSFPLFWPVLALGVLTILAVVLGFIALIIPGFLAIFFLTFAIYILVDKKVGPIEAMKESYELTKRNWKLVASYFIVTAVIQLPSSPETALGDVISFALSIVYLVLPAILYVRMQQQNPVESAAKK